MTCDATKLGRIQKTVLAKRNVRVNERGAGYSVRSKSVLAEEVTGEGVCVVGRRPRLCLQIGRGSGQLAPQTRT